MYITHGVESVLWNPGLPETRSTFSCVCKKVSIYVFFFIFFFIYLYKGKKTTTLCQIDRKQTGFKKVRDVDVNAARTESNRTRWHCSIPEFWRVAREENSFFSCCCTCFSKWKHFFPTLSPTFSIVLVAAFLLLLWTPGKTKVFVNCQWPRRRKTNKQTNTLKQNQKLTNQKSRHLWSEPQAPTHVSYFTLSLSPLLTFGRVQVFLPQTMATGLCEILFFFFAVFLF